MLLAFVFLYYIGRSSACWGGGGGGGGEEESTKASMLDPHNKQHWGGWDPPPGAGNSWQDWLVKYKQGNAGKGGYKDPKSPGKPYGHGVPGWPPDWAGLGPPMEGFAPPPWAYVPKNLGKPIFCYDSPLYGDCHQYMTRYGYNPYMDECQAFTYSGCGGNRNNFEKLEKCQQACVHPPVSGCSSDSEIPVDYMEPS